MATLLCKLPGAHNLAPWAPQHHVDDECVRCYNGRVDGEAQHNVKRCYSHDRTA